MASTVVLYFLAIEYKVSPTWTICVFVEIFSLLVGIFKICPILNVLLVKLFKFLMASTVVLYFLAIEYKVSPTWTVWTLEIFVSRIGIFKTWPTLKVLSVKSLRDFIASTVTLYFLAIEYKVSPFKTT